MNRAGRDATETELGGYEGRGVMGEAREELSGLPEPVAGAGGGGDGAHEPGDGMVAGQLSAEVGGLGRELEEAGQEEAIEGDL